MEQFPKAFMVNTVVEEDDDEESPSKVDKYVLLKQQTQSAQWSSPAHAKAFENYVDTMLGFVKRHKKGSSVQMIIDEINASAFVDYLTSNFAE
jgi:NAD(P)H-hydrate repair Nnr-like enzyme with NAD(P)H-hydrate epimerase domain